jgi:lysophospholipase L1-like esterase
MLARFQTDVINPGYARVVILAGTNDIWHPVPSSSYALTSLQSMTAMADQNGVQVVLSLLPPMNPTDVVIDPQTVINYNAGIRSLAQSKGYLLIDYYDPLLGHPELFNDGVHPNAGGYVVMQTALSSVVTR